MKLHNRKSIYYLIFFFFSHLFLSARYSHTLRQFAYNTFINVTRDEGKSPFRTPRLHVHKYKSVRTYVTSSSSSSSTYCGVGHRGAFGFLVFSLTSLLFRHCTRIMTIYATITNRQDTYYYTYRFFFFFFFLPRQYLRIRPLNRRTAVIRTPFGVFCKRHNAWYDDDDDDDTMKSGPRPAGYAYIIMYLCRLKKRRKKKRLGHTSRWPTPADIRTIIYYAGPPLCAGRLNERIFVTLRAVTGIRVVL